ncbi:MAG: sulfotransferase domain-containing protein [Bacteroidetes bacterium]|nr:sulfotransferase domain-containing protein [Bacteroidota bacterium]
MNIKHKDKQIFLPDFLIVGAARSGTSSLYFHLREHPEVFMPEFKEPHFFSFYGKGSPHPNVTNFTFDFYTDLFSKALIDQTIGEASASYLYYYDESINNIKKIYGRHYKKVKIIIILRNPIDRAWSYYMLRKKSGYTKDFRSVVAELKVSGDQKQFHNFILSGKYYKGVKEYFQNFDNVHLAFFEELTENKKLLYKKILKFLNVSNLSYIPNNFSIKYNRSGVSGKRIYAPIYKFLYQNNKVKELLKPLVPYAIRQNIKGNLDKIIIEKKTIPGKERKILQNEFTEDLTELLSFLTNENEKGRIQSWL